MPRRRKYSSLSRTAPHAKVTRLSRMNQRDTIQSGVSDVQPGPSGVQPVPSGVQPGPSSVQPGPSGVQPGLSGVQSGRSSRILYSERRAQNTSTNQRLKWSRKINAAFNYNFNILYESDKLLSIGSMHVVCPHCRAMKWKDETLGMCCEAGKVVLPPLMDPPEPLKSLIEGNKRFLNQIRNYNSAFQMTSFGANIVREGNYMPTFKVQGQVYHSIGSLLPQNNEVPKFLQIYFMGDAAKEAEVRCNNFQNLEPFVVLDLQAMLHQENAYVREFKTVLDAANTNLDAFQVIIHAERVPDGAHAGRFNSPTSSEVAILITGQQFQQRDIIITSKCGVLRRISEIHRSYDCLQYPLLFPRGEDGYNIQIPQTNPTTHQPDYGKTVSCMSFYAYRIMIRLGELNYLLCFKMLFNQFLVDMYAKIETERLNFIKNHQAHLRADQYIHLQDAVNQDGDLSNAGKLVILPSSFVGGPRYMHEKMQDGMTYVRAYGRPDLFITFTCNKNWPEISNNLFEGQKAEDRHDIISRVFRLKVKKLMHFINKANIFGYVRCFMYSVEWQKRGLPHVHLLVWLEEKITPDRVDSIICAEIPKKEEDLKLFNTVKSSMVHGPCGVFNMNSPCMRDGKCTKKFPKKFITDTQTADDGYPLYRRRSPDGGRSFKMKMRTGDEVEIDNRWIVPYCPLLSRIFDAHINVEYCHSVKSIKYICNYINKGSDQATFELQQQNEHDEVSVFQTGRYISTSEAVWRILEFPIHERHPTVVQLDVHLENGQRVYFTPTDDPQSVLSQPPRSTLLSFFDLCQRDDFAKTLFYNEVPQYYTISSRKTFQRRKLGKAVEGYPGVFRSDALGRVYTIHPNNRECYFLRLLLHTIPGPTSFTYLKTINNVVHDTFESACKSLGLLENDDQWNKTLQDAAISESPKTLRYLFVIMLSMCHLSDARQLWEEHKNNFSEDIFHRYQGNLDEMVRDLIYNETLILLEDLLLTMGDKKLKDFGLPEPSRIDHHLTPHGFNQVELNSYVQQHESNLTNDQRVVYDKVLESVNQQLGKIFFLDAPGGTGKTYITNLLLAKVRSTGKIAIASASLGIAATLLQGGKTVHSVFKLPFNLHQSERPMCNISKGSKLGRMFQECSLIVWDECTMSHKLAVETVDRSLRDLCGKNEVMGGITVLFLGDFRQTLPVVARGTRADEVNASLKSSSIWSRIVKLSLSTNMRVHLHNDQGAAEFSKALLDIGDGKIEPISIGGREIALPPDVGTLVNHEEDLINRVYPDLQNLSQKPSSWLCERAILCPRNDEVHRINEKLLQCWNGEEKCYKSVDTVLNTDDAVNYPVEFLNSLDLPGMPPHELNLKIGSPIMLLRNLDAPRLCNGTRLRVLRLREYIIEAEVMTGCARGEVVFIPRIPLTPSSDSVFEFKRLQFPVRVCFAMTINKAQGQSLSVAGIHLRNPCFSHGQLYVALSRVSSRDSLYLLIPDGRRTSNIVYTEVLH